MSRGGRREPARGGGARVVGRNAVVEALRAGVPATSLQLARGSRRDPRLAEAVRLAASAGISVYEVDRSVLDEQADAHQGLSLIVRAYDYRHPDDLLAAAGGAATPALIVACDAVSDPRNLGAIARAAAAFGAHGLLVPERRAAGVTPTAWKASAGAFARLPVARATNLVRTLRSFAAAGLTVAGLTAGGDADVTGFDAAGPLVLVLGGEGRGLSRLVRESCDVLVGIGLARGVESLNVAVAAGIALHEVARRRARG